VESGEFPDVSNIEARMLPLCYDAGLPSGHVSDAAQFMSIATETFIKEILSQIFSRTRSNGPGDSGNAGFGPGGAWIQTNKYRKQLAKEEEACQRGEISERGPLGMSDLRIALSLGDCGMANFPVIYRQIMFGYKEGELEDWNDHTFIDGRDRIEDLDVEMGGTTNGIKPDVLTNGTGHGDQMDIDSEFGWEGADDGDEDFLDGVLDSCLAVG
jgi:transcriptional coactivator HFI1/ADA1